MFDISQIFSVQVFFIYFIVLIFLAVRYDFFNTNKTASRLEWWVVAVPVIIIIIKELSFNVSGVPGLGDIAMSFSFLYIIFSALFISSVTGPMHLFVLALLVPYCIVSVRRYKSLNKSWTWIFWAFAPLGLIVQAVELGFCKSVK